MRKLNPLWTITLALSGLFWAGCRKMDLVPGVLPIAIVTNVKFDPSAGNYNFPLNTVRIKLINLQTGNSYEAQSDETGITLFRDLSAGAYDAEAIAVIPKEVYESVTGISTDKDSVVFNARLSNLLLNGNTDNRIPLSLQVGRLGDWVIKQIYYTGSHTKDGAGFRDQFIELYNNSNDTLYADSLYFSQLIGSNTKLGSVDLSRGYFITNPTDPLYKQLDWSKSLDMPAGTGPEANTDYVYAKAIFRIPGSGSDYPVNPGESIIIASTALNHKAPYSDNKGKSIEVNNPDLTVDMSQADFEVYLADEIVSPLATDVNNPSVPNLIAVDRGNNKDLILDPLGRDAYVIFTTTANIAEEWKKVAAPDEDEISASTTRYFQIPVNAVIDAVAIAHADPSARVAAKLPARLDAGFYFAPDGQYSSESIIRRVSKTIDGRKVLMDTNNSSNDFDYLQKAAPRAFK